MGFVQDKIGAHRSMIICLIIQSIAMLILPLIKIDLALFAFAIVFGFTYGGDVPQTPVIIVQSFGMAAMSIIYSSIQTIGNLSGAAGPFLAGYVFDLTGSYTLIFIVAGAGLLIGAFCISRIKPRY
jgi:MFS family permease